MAVELAGFGMRDVYELRRDESQLARLFWNHLRDCPNCTLAVGTELDACADGIRAMTAWTERMLERRLAQSMSPDLSLQDSLVEYAQRTRALLFARDYPVGARVAWLANGHPQAGTVEAVHASWWNELSLWVRNDKTGKRPTVRLSDHVRVLSLPTAPPSPLGADLRAETPEAVE